MTPRIFMGLHACCWGAVLAAGCSGGGGQGVDPGNLNKIARAYQQATEMNGQPPRGPSDLKPFLEEVDAALVSPNDGQSYVILWGTDPRKEKGLKPGVIGYEKAGKGGRRFVFTSMGVTLMADAEFTQANFPKGHRP